MTVENLEINVKTNVSGSSAKTITSLADALGKLEAKAAALTGLSNLSALASAMQSISGATVRASAFSGMAKGIENLSAALKTITNDDIARLTVMANTLRGLNNVNLGGLGNAQSISKAANSLNRTAKEIDNVSQSAKKAQGPLGNFAASLKRIAYYRLIRTVIKEITQAIKEGINNLYEFSKANGDFGGIASRFDGLASAAKTLKNQLGATFGQMLAALTPALIALLNLITKITEACYPLVRVIAALEPVITTVANAVTFLVEQLIALMDLLGLNVGKIVADDATASWKEASKAAGDYKRTILGFDVINRLNGPSGGGGSNNGGTFSMSDYNKIVNAPDWNAWWVPFIKGGENAVKVLDAVLVKAKELVGIKAPELKLSMEVLPGYSQVLESLKARLGELMAGSPYLVTVGVRLMPGTQMVFNQLRNWIIDLLNPSPYTVGVALETVPSFADVLASIWENLNKLKAESPVVISIMLAKVPSFETVYQNVLEHVKRMRGVSPVVLLVALAKITSFVPTYNDVLEHVKRMLGFSPVILNVGLEILPSFKPAFNWVMDRVRELLSKSPIMLEVGMQKVGESATANAFTHRSGSFQVAAAPSKGDIPPMENIVPSREAVAGVEKSANNVTKGLETLVGEAILVGASVWAASQVRTVEANRMTSIGGGGGSFGNRLAESLFASGGFPTKGQLFIAREAGPELVGTIGGRTAVANNDQIKNALYDAVYNAQMAANRNSDTPDRPINVRVFLDSREIKTGQQRLARMTGG